MHDLDATIVAVATPPGRGGIGCVRLSGPQAHRIASSLFEPASGTDPLSPARLRFGRFLDRDGQAVDHGYLVLFEEGNAFTGEASAELWAHGSPAVLKELVEAVISAGGSAAGPGEFTYRALRNGRLDLARSEAVRDLVAARTLYQARVAFAQAEGALSRRLQPLREMLADLLAGGEAAVEFSEESETQLPPDRFKAGIEQAMEACLKLLQGYRTGRLVREGATLAITGMPNAGKSSLFNKLLFHERAIVTEIPGTTRDTLEESLEVGGIPVRLVDTAGITDSTDTVEMEGVRRARQACREADLVMLVIDGSRDLLPLEEVALEEITAGDDNDRTLVVVNKADLPGFRAGHLPHPEAMAVSAMTGDGLGVLRKQIEERLGGCDTIPSEGMLTNIRHAEALALAVDSLRQAIGAAEKGMSEELVLVDLREAMQAIGTITGEYTTEDLYDRIFSTFCIGK